MLLFPRAEIDALVEEGKRAGAKTVLGCGGGKVRWCRCCISFREHVPCAGLLCLLWESLQAHTHLP